MKSLAVVFVFALFGSSFALAKTITYKGRFQGEPISVTYTINDSAPELRVEHIPCRSGIDLSDRCSGPDNLGFFIDLGEVSFDQRSDVKDGEVSDPNFRLSYYSEDKPMKEIFMGPVSFNNTNFASLQKNGFMFILGDLNKLQVLIEDGRVKRVELPETIDISYNFATNPSPKDGRITLRRQSISIHK